MKKKILWRRILQGGALSYWLCLFMGCGGTEPGSAAMGVIQLGNCSIRAEIAQTPEVRKRGLSGRVELASDGGMLFIFPRPDYYAFWMKDTHIPLDLIWIRGDTVLEISAGLPPGADMDENLLPHYYPSRKIDRVLEVRAGTAARCGVRPGDKIKLIPPE